MKNYITTVILICFGLLLEAQTSSGKHHIKYLDINTGNSEYGVDFTNTGKVVFARATSDKVVNSSKYQPHLDLFVGDMGEQGEILNKTRNKGVATKKITKTGAAFTNDGKTVYFSAKKYSKRKSKRSEKSQLFKAEIDAEGYWINVEKLDINKKNYTIEHPTLNKDNTKLYFSSDLPSTQGGKDIFIAEIKADGTLEKPRSLGDKINTPKDEITPYIADNNFLYFSSNGREDSLGSFDIYTSEAFENTVSEPLHLDSPINSINDDFAYIVNSDKGYFSSNRLQGQDNNDIYSFYIEPDKPEVCYQQIIGTVRDLETEKVLPFVTVSIINDNGDEVEKLTTDENGNYKYNLGCRDSFTVKASKEGYSSEEHIVNTANYTESPSLEVNQSLKKEFVEVEEKVTININPIYFDFDKFNIKEDAKAELDRIVKVMKENPQIEVESASHTDSRGPKAYNQKLSERRAKASVDYIVSQGIERGRIKSKGYGESQLLNKCTDGVRCKAEDHKLNRRTEFVIINKQTLKANKESSKGAIIVVSGGDMIKSSDDDPPNENSSSITEEEINEEETNESPIIEQPKEEEDLQHNDSEEKESSELNQKTISNEETSVSIIDKNNLIKDFKVPAAIENEEPVEEVTITNTYITVTDNQEDKLVSNTEAKSSIDKLSTKNSLKKNDTNLGLIPDKGKINNTPLANQSNNNNKEYEKEEALTSASSFVKTNLNNEIALAKLNAVNENTIVEATTKEKVLDETAKKSSLLTEEILEKDLSVKNEKDIKTNISNQTIATKKSSTKPEDIKNKYNESVETISQEIADTSTSTKTSSEENNDSSMLANIVDEKGELKTVNEDKKNITAASKNLFNGDEDLYIASTQGGFNRDLEKDITFRDNRLKAKNISSDYRSIIAQKKVLFKKEYLLSTKDLKKEEVLVINSIDVSPISIRRSGKYIVTDNARKVDVMRIKFQIDNNKHITSGYKEVYILIQNPNGIILNRKGTFEVNNSEPLTYTEKTNAYYNNNHLNISMVTDRFIQRIVKGIYTITIYIEGYPVGLEMVELL